MPLQRLPYPLYPPHHPSDVFDCVERVEFGDGQKRAGRGGVAVALVDDLVAAVNN